MDHCDGSDATIVADRACHIPAAILNASPFALQWGSSVYAKITATNIKGTSTESNAGNGAIILTDPDPPINLLEDTSYRTSSTLALTWEAGATEGGTPVIDYRVLISDDGVNYSVLQEGETDFHYVATGLTAGTIYSFVVQSRNAYEYSNDSEVLQLLCAQIPEQPEAPTTTTIANQIRVSWPQPITNGSPLTAFKIFILESDGVTYTQESVDCDGNSQTVIDSNQCFIYLDTLTAAPYSLSLNEEVWAKIQTQNYYGWSPISLAGNDGLIKLVPDAPVNLQNDPTVTAAE